MWSFDAHVVFLGRPLYDVCTGAVRMQMTCSGRAPWRRLRIGCAAVLGVALAHADGNDVHFPSNEDLRQVRALSDPWLCLSIRKRTDGRPLGGAKTSWRQCNN